MQSRVLYKIESIAKMVKYFIPPKQSWFPFVPNFTNENIYISAGGEISSSMKKRELNFLTDKLRESNFLSVRDTRTMHSLENQNISCTLLPDSAILMSKVYSLEHLMQAFENKQGLSIDKGNYIFLQVGNEKGPTDLNEFSKSINKLAAKKEYTVLCCPIGQAPRHEDHLILKELCQKNKAWIYYDPQSIFEIMLLIAKASVFMGTSLHGIITSYAYNIPVIALNTSLAKNKSFIETWCNEFYGKPIDFCEIDNNAEIILQKWDRIKAQAFLVKQQKMVEDYFSEISQYLSSK
jgi:polysaccharide pyruvyl transferase WcaK-like protein